MTTHVHTDDCYDEVHGVPRLVCLRPPQPRPYEGWDAGPPAIAEDPVPRRLDRHADHRPCHHWIVWVALGLAWLIGGLLLAWGASEIAKHATPRAAAIPTTLVAARDLSGHLEGTSGSPLPGAPLPGVAQSAEHLAPDDQRPDAAGAEEVDRRRAPADAAADGRRVVIMIKPTDDGHLKHSGRRDTLYNVTFGACDNDAAVITDTWQRLHDILIAGNPVRLGPVQGGWYRVDATRAELEELEVPADVLDFVAANPGTVVVVAMVEIPAR